jgi:hypothetical protein
LEAQTASEERVLAATVAADKQQLASLEQLLAESRSEQERIRAEAKEAADRGDALNAFLAAANKRSEAQIAALTQDRDATATRLAQSQAGYQAVQDELNTLRSQHGQDMLRLASMDQKVSGLNAALIDREKRVSNDEEYLSSDKDIRDLIGARNLYIADIMDVDGSGKSKKPFGRVFYTKTKSLVFYAYDLDLQQGVKQASTFQVWGRTSATDRKPVNLGVLYMDSETNRRWTLRVNNPQQLAQLDAIFVTVEPHMQDEKPTGKPFLYASLRRDANHP